MRLPDRRLRVWMLALVIAAVALVLAQSIVTSDFERLQGTWHLVSATFDGKPWVDDALLKAVDVRWTFKGKKRHVMGNFQGFGERGQVPDDVKIDPNASPKTIDIVNPTDKTEEMGIYRFDRKRLLICWHQKGDGTGGRPNAFQSKQGSGDWLMVFNKK